MYAPHKNRSIVDMPVMVYSRAHANLMVTRESKKRTASFQLDQSSALPTSSFLCANAAELRL